VNKKENNLICQQNNKQTVGNEQNTNNLYFKNCTTEKEHTQNNKENLHQLKKKVSTNKYK
jgi:hypothetical protein